MPIAEYEKETPEISGKRVIINMKSTQSDMTGVGFFSVRYGEDEAPERLLKDAFGTENNKYTLISEGILEMKEGRLCLSYDEEAIEGVEGCSTVISFEPETPECITVERVGPLSSAFVISKGERVFSVYSTPYGNIDMCTYGRKVENSITENGGTLVLDYAVELRGMTAQRTRMEVDVKEAK